MFSQYILNGLNSNAPWPKERGLSSQVNNGRFQSKTTGPTIDNPLDLTKKARKNMF